METTIMEQAAELHIPEFQIRGIPAAMVDSFWAYAEPYIKRALDHTAGELLPIDLKNLCKAHEVQLWLISKNKRVVAAVTTEIINYPQRKHCRIITMAGSSAQDWAGDLDVILTAWAKEQGCIALEAFVRKGFVPKLMEYGYKHKYSAVLKEI